MKHTFLVTTTFLRRMELLHFTKCRKKKFVKKFRIFYFVNSQAVGDKIYSELFRSKINIFNTNSRPKIEMLIEN